jgi:hypothetical protein
MLLAFSISFPVSKHITVIILSITAVILSFKGLNAQSLLQIAPTQAGVVAQTVIPALRRLRQEDCKS